MSPSHDQVGQDPDEGKDEDEEHPEGLGPPLQVVAAEDVEEHHDHEPDLNEEQTEPKNGVDGLAHAERLGNHWEPPIAVVDFLLVARAPCRHHELAILDPDGDGRPVTHFAGQQGPRDAGFDVVGDEAAQRASAVDRVEALPSDVTSRFFVDVERYATFGQPGPDVFEEEVDDTLDLGRRQGLEQHDVVDAIQELRAELV